jgi:hypothetical protein
VAATPDEELSQLEKDLRQLQIEYETYFAGGRKRPPNDTEWRVQTAIKKFGDNSGKLKYAQIFRYNSLAAKYAKFSEIWRQRAKRVEEGRSAYGYSKVARELEQKRLAEAERQHAARIHGASAAEAAAISGRVAVTDPLKESEKVQELYKTMLEAKQQAGEKADINFEQFHKFVRSKTEQLRQQMGCQQVEYTVSVENGQVKLKAKAV